MLCFTQRLCTHQTIGASVSLDAMLIPNIASPEKCHEPVQVNAGCSAHQPAASIAHAWLFFAGEVVETFRCVAVEEAGTPPSAHLLPLERTASFWSIIWPYASTTVTTANMAKEPVAPFSCILHCDLSCVI